MSVFTTEADFETDSTIGTEVIFAEVAEHARQSTGHEYITTIVARIATR